MADDKFFQETLRAVSQSQDFQAFLRSNPQLVQKAARDRDYLALQYLQAKNLAAGFSQPQYAAGALAGFNPNIAPVNYRPPHAPYTYETVSYGGAGITINATGVPLGSFFDFTASTGPAQAFFIRTPDHSFHSIDITVSDATDAILVYYGNPGTLPADDNVFNYTAVPASGSPTVYHVNLFTGAGVAFAIHHSGSLPLVNATISVAIGV